MQISNVHHQVDLIESCIQYASQAGACEKQWAEKITIEQRKLEFLAIWGYVRVALANYLQVDPESLKFARTKYGKPFLTNYALAFNVSHTKQYVALCYSNTVDACGIDIEVPRDMSDMMGIAKRFFAPSEYALLEALPNTKQRMYYFFKYWVIKEAILKTCGLGLSFGIEKVLVDIANDQSQGEVVLTIDGQTQGFIWQFEQSQQYPFYLATAVA